LSLSINTVIPSPTTNYTVILSLSKNLAHRERTGHERRDSSTPHGMTEAGARNDGATRSLRRFGVRAFGTYRLSFFLAAGAAHRFDYRGGRVHFAVAEPVAVAVGVVVSLVDTENAVGMVRDDFFGNLYQDFPYLELRCSRSA
jgi:hypothetical protein